MIKRPLTRRRFVAGCAGVAGAAALSGATLQAFAEGGDIGPGARPKWDTVHTICQGCPNACGYTAYVVDGVLGKTIGDTSNPNSAGNLCAIGYGDTQSIYSSANVKNPLKRKPDGSFHTITWEQALDEISSELTSFIETDGAESLALIYDGTSPDTRLVSNLLGNGLGCPNVFVDDVTYDVVKAAAFKQTIGADSYTADVANADAVVLLDTSLTDIATPDLVAALQDARAANKTIIAVDPRIGTLGAFANDWIPVNPGTELALLLAVCNYLIARGRYNEDYVAANVADFDTWADAISEFTPQWAEGITGVQSYRIEHLATTLAEAAPKVAIQYGNGDISGISYANASELARVVCLLNTMLGTWNATGGALLPFDYKTLFKAVDGGAVPGEANALADDCTVQGIAAADAGAGAAAAFELIRRRHLRGLITVGADLAYEYADATNVDSAFKNLELFVCITQEMNETAELADYVLPISDYLESASLPQFVSANFAAVAMADQVVEHADGDNSMSYCDIADCLALACGEAYDAEDVPSALAGTALAKRLATLGLTLEGLAQVGTAAINEAVRISKWNTPSGKIQCASAALEAAGSPAMPVWVAPIGMSNVVAVVSDDMNLGQENNISIVIADDETVGAAVAGSTTNAEGDVTHFDSGEAAEKAIFHLITGPSTVIGNTGANVAELMDIAEKYELDNAWINSNVAELLGIENEDKVVIHSSDYAYEATAYVTDRIVPTAVFMPSNFGHTAPRQHVSNGIGANTALFTDFLIDDTFGTLCTQEASVRVYSEKEGA